MPMITKGVTPEFFSVKSLSYMLNNIHAVALHVFDVHNVFFVISSQDCSIKSDAILMLLIASHLNLQRHTSATNTARFKHLKMVNSWKHWLEIYKSNLKGIRCNKFHYFDQIIESYITNYILNKVTGNQ